MKLEYIKLLGPTFNSFWSMHFFILNIDFSCMNVLLDIFKIWSTSDNRLSIAIPQRVAKFSDSVSLLSIWSFSWVTFSVDCYRNIIGIYAGSLSRYYFWTTFPSIRIHFLMFQAMCLYFWMGLKSYCHLKNCKYQNFLIPLASSKEILLWWPFKIPICC